MIVNLNSRTIAAYHTIIQNRQLSELNNENKKIDRHRNVSPFIEVFFKFEEAESHHNEKNYDHRNEH